MLSAMIRDIEPMSDGNRFFSYVRRFRPLGDAPDIRTFITNIKCDIDTTHSLIKTIIYYKKKKSIYIKYNFKIYFMLLLSIGNYFEVNFAFTFRKENNKIAH